MQTDLPLPQDTQAEQETIGAMLDGPQALTAVLAVVSSKDFFREAHWQITSCIEELVARRDEVTLTTVAALQKGRGQDEANGGIDYLRACVGKHLGLRSSLRAARLVREMAQRRALVQKADAMQATAMDTSNQWQAVVNEASGAVAETLRETLAGEAGLRPAADLDSQWGEMIESAARGRKPLEPVRWGIEELDWYTMPLSLMRVIVLKGSTGTGKTQWAVHTVCSTAKALIEAGDPRQVLIFSLEARGIYQRRMLSWVSGIDARTIRQGFDGGTGQGLADYRKLRGARETLARWPVAVCEDVTDQAGIESRIRVEAERQPVALVVVDNWQQMSKGLGRNKVEEYEAAALSFKELFEELAIPGVVLSQMSYNKDTGKWQAKESRAIQEVAYLDLRLNLEAKTQAYTICCDKARDTEYFQPLEVVCDFGTSTITSKRSQDAAGQIAKGHGIPDDNRY